MISTDWFWRSSRGWFEFWWESGGIAARLIEKVKETPTPFEKRMEKYSSSSNLPHHLEVHWFSIINSCVTVLLLTGFLATILMRVLKNDFVKGRWMSKPRQVTTDSTRNICGTMLGKEFVGVYVDALENNGNGNNGDEMLPRPLYSMKTMRDAIGFIVAWPVHMLKDLRVQLKPAQPCMMETCNLMWMERQATSFGVNKIDFRC